MDSQSFAFYTYHCPDGHDYTIKINEDGEAFIEWAGKEYDANGFDYFSNYKYQKEYEKFLGKSILKEKYNYDKKYAIKKLGGKCAICGSTEDLRISNVKIYCRNEENTSTYEKIKEILDSNTNKKEKASEKYILLCQSCSEKRKKVLMKLINYYELHKDKIGKVFVIPDNIKKYMEALKVPFEIIKKSFPYSEEEVILKE